MNVRCLTVDAEHPAFAGHFPGRPIWPGVLLLAEVCEAVRANPVRSARLGPTPSIVVAKFLAPVRPGDELQVQLVDATNGVRFELRRGETVVAKGELRPGAEGAG